MASLTVPRNAPRSGAGINYGQKTVTSADASGNSVEIVPALTGYRAVIDRVGISTAAAEVVYIMAGNDALVDTFNLTAGGIHYLYDISSDVISEAIKIDTVDSGTISVIVHYHYEE